MSAFERGWAQPSNGWCFTVNDDPTALSGVVFCDLLSGEQRCHGRGTRERFQAHEVGARRRLLASSRPRPIGVMKCVRCQRAFQRSAPSESWSQTGWIIVPPVPSNYSHLSRIFCSLLIHFPVRLCLAIRQIQNPDVAPPGCTRSSPCQTCPFRFRLALL